MDDFRDKFMGFAIILFIIAILVGIVVNIAVPTRQQECEKVTWYEYGEKKRGEVCKDK